MTVFVVQNQHRLDRETNQLVPKFDMQPATEYGELKFLLDPSASPFRPVEVVQQLRDGLEGFSNDDYLLLVGNPILIGWAMAIAADYNGNVAALQWSGKEGKYICVEAQVLPYD